MTNKFACIRIDYNRITKQQYIFLVIVYICSLIYTSSSLIHLNHNQSKINDENSYYKSHINDISRMLTPNNILHIRNNKPIKTDKINQHRQNHHMKQPPIPKEPTIQKLKEHPIIVQQNKQQHHHYQKHNIQSTTNNDITINKPISSQHRLAFHLTCINDRGTTVAVYDYADYSERILNYSTPIIIYFKTNKLHDHNGNNTKFVQKFIDRFGQDNVYGIDKIRVDIPKTSHKKDWIQEWEKIDEILLVRNITDIYILRDGSIATEKLSSLPNVRNLVHCVFNARVHYGDVFARISSTVPIKPNTIVPVVPHMIPKPLHISLNLRKILNIPRHAIVFGRYGGYTTFNIKPILSAVCSLAFSNDNIYFLFANTKPFCSFPHTSIVINDFYGTNNKTSSSSSITILNKNTTNVVKNIIHIENLLIYQEQKEIFINTCNAMLHARLDGETFGLSIAEFSNKGIYYEDGKSLISIIVNFHSIYHTKSKEINSTWNAYEQFYPENVMKLFDEVFLNPIPINKTLELRLPSNNI